MEIRNLNFLENSRLSVIVHRLWLYFLWVFRQIKKKKTKPKPFTFTYIAQMALCNICILGWCQSLFGTLLNLWPLAIIMIFVFWVAVISFFFLKQFLNVSSLCYECVVRILPCNFSSFCSHYNNLYLMQKKKKCEVCYSHIFALKIICTSQDKI